MFSIFVRNAPGVKNHPADAWQQMAAGLPYPPCLEDSWRREVDSWPAGWRCYSSLSALSVLQRWTGRCPGAR